MIVYGEIKSNLVRRSNQFNLETNYSIDSLLFEDPSGIEFLIDFEDGDYATEQYNLSFRLKSLGCTFEEDWKDLKRNKSLHIEEDYHFFKRCKLKQMNLYVSSSQTDDLEDLLSSTDFELLELYMYIKGGQIHFKPGKVKVAV